MHKLADVLVLSYISIPTQTAMFPQSLQCPVTTWSVVTYSYPYLSGLLYLPSYTVFCTCYVHLASYVLSLLYLVYWLTQLCLIQSAVPTYLWSAMPILIDIFAQSSMHACMPTQSLLSDLCCYLNLLSLTLVQNAIYVPLVTQSIYVCGNSSSRAYEMV